MVARSFEYKSFGEKIENWQYVLAHICINLSLIDKKSDKNNLFDSIILFSEMIEDMRNFLSIFEGIYLQSKSSFGQICSAEKKQEIEIFFQKIKEGCHLTIDSEIGPIYFNQFIGSRALEKDEVFINQEFKDDLLNESKSLLMYIVNLAPYLKTAHTTSIN